MVSSVSSTHRHRQKPTDRDARNPATAGSFSAPKPSFAVPFRSARLSPESLYACNLFVSPLPSIEEFQDGSEGVFEPHLDMTDSLKCHGTEQKASSSEEPVAGGANKERYRCAQPVTGPLPAAGR